MTATKLFKAGYTDLVSVIPPGAELSSLVASAWNPLADDGDALRLAVKLGMCVATQGVVEPDRSIAYIKINDVVHGLSEEHGNDPYAATRRAIVRAAAEIGARGEK